MEEFQPRPVITEGPVVHRHADFHVPVSCSLRYNLFLFIRVDKYKAVEHVQYDEASGDCSYHLAAPTSTQLLSIDGDVLIFKLSSF